MTIPRQSRQTVNYINIFFIFCPIIVSIKKLHFALWHSHDLKLIVEFIQAFWNCQRYLTVGTDGLCCRLVTKLTQYIRGNVQMMV